MSIIEKAMEKALKERAENTNQSSAPTSKAPEKNLEPVDILLQGATKASTTSTEHIAPSQITPVQNAASSPMPVNVQAPSQEKAEQEPALAQQTTQEHTQATPEADKQKSTENVGSTQDGSPVQLRPIKELIMATDEAFTLGGSYRLLKEYIIALRKSHPEKSMFMVTSAMRNEGKTLTSCNLACALAMEFDTTVLLIDVDLRAPSCHRVLGVKNPPKGLSDCLMHNTPITDCLIHTGIGKLSLLCAGSIIDNSAELITSKRMHDFLAEVKHRYPDRIVILDSLPLLPFAESRALSRMVDGVMLVVRENVTYKSHVEASLKQLQDVPLLGMVYNAATAYGTEKDILNYSYYNYTDKEYSKP